jgi:hypothetical protein
MMRRILIVMLALGAAVPDSAALLAQPRHAPIRATRTADSCLICARSIALLVLAMLLA